MRAANCAALSAARPGGCFSAGGPPPFCNNRKRCFHILNFRLGGGLNNETLYFANLLL